MSPLKEAGKSSEHVGLTIFPRAFDLWNVSPHFQMRVAVALQ